MLGEVKQGVIPLQNRGECLHPGQPYCSGVSPFGVNVYDRFPGHEHDHSGEDEHECGHAALVQGGNEDAYVEGFWC